MSVDTTPTKYVMNSFGSRPALVITLPGKWVQSRQDGPDFDVHWLVSNELGGSLGIYVGHHPHDVERSAISITTTQMVGALPVEFCITPLPGGKRQAGAIVGGFFKEGYPLGFDWMSLHFMINASKPEFLDLVWQGLKTLVSFNVNPTQFILSPYGKGAPPLSVWLPGKWEQRRDDGPDFDVHCFVSDTFGVVLSIYVGHHPQPVPNLPSTTKVTKQVGNLPVEFSITTGEHGQKYEAIVNDFFNGAPGSGVDSLQLHIMLETAKPDLLPIVWDYLKNLKRQEEKPK